MGKYEKALHVFYNLNILEYYFAFSDGIFFYTCTISTIIGHEQFNEILKSFEYPIIADTQDFFSGAKSAAI